MAKVSAKYEVVYIVDPTRTEEEIQAVIAKFTALAEQNATAVEVEEWGKRKLAYEIDDKTEGYYVLMSFTSEAAFPAELDRIFGITDGIMRSMIVCRGE
jgi:small subunit ribosomal protein S6